MRAFIAGVPFTILEAVNFVISNKIEDADLYLVDVFRDSAHVCENIRKTGLFREVYFVDDVLLTDPITIKKCISTVKNAKKFLRTTKGRKYDIVYYNNGGWLINSIFYTAFYRENKKIKSAFLEHGYYFYRSNYSTDKPWYLKPLIRLVGLKCMDGTMLDELHVFHPELMMIPYQAKVLKMTPIDKNNPQLKQIINQIFDYHADEDEFLQKDIIILEQGPIMYEFEQEAFWDKIFNKIDKDRAIIKAHPRQKSSALQGKGIDVCRNHTLPWEIEILNLDFSKKYQITDFSTSGVSPKMWFDEEPTVILLYKLLPIDKKAWGAYEESLIDFMNKLGRTYVDKEKFFVPESFEEFEEYCKNHGIMRKV